METSNPLVADQGDFQARSLDAWKRASILHLVDLKRAGYSPTQTELAVDQRSDRIIAEPERPKRRRGR